jgi:sensor domain CHASE-containing protein
MSWVVKLTLPVVLVLSMTSTTCFAQDSMASKQQRFNQSQEGEGVNQNVSKRNLCR